MVRKTLVVNRPLGRTDTVRPMAVLMVFTVPVARVKVLVRTKTNITSTTPSPVVFW